jgi:GTP-binding protein
MKVIKSLLLQICLTVYIAHVFPRSSLCFLLQVVVVVNKIDRPAARAEWVVDSTFELFMDLGATDEQCDFPVVYASGVNGIAGMSPTELSSDLQPLFETIVREVRGDGVTWDDG